ncbi:hypothetical protein [Cellvibrio sp. NN19]|uniref:hypothetical protein n=1 Tax=Cellvibrio chitinivorans TaxID=3102792 RepID=UPI002B401350|nr:hypothetical protein [Cellvibrio sp. NN19]
MAVKYCTGKRAAHIAMRNPQTSRSRIYPQQSPAVQEVMQTSAVGTVSGNSSLPANLHSASADPRAVVTAADSAAAGYLTSATIFSFLDSMMLDMAMNNSSSNSFLAYLNRFDTPEQVGTRFRNRFSGQTYATEAQAQARELESLSARFENIGTYLDAGIGYISNDRSRVSIGSCRDRCSAHPAWGAWTCPERSARAIALCPPFWSSTAGEQATMIVHELAHLRYGLQAHNAGNQRQRGRNPECYASYIADVFGFSSYSNQCPRV